MRSRRSTPQGRRARRRRGTPWCWRVGRRCRRSPLPRRRCTPGNRRCPRRRRAIAADAVAAVAAGALPGGIAHIRLGEAARGEQVRNVRGGHAAGVQGAAAVHRQPVNVAAHPGSQRRPAGAVPLGDVIRAHAAGRCPPAPAHFPLLRTPPRLIRWNPIGCRDDGKCLMVPSTEAGLACARQCETGKISCQSKCSDGSCDRPCLDAQLECAKECPKVQWVNSVFEAPPPLYDSSGSETSSERLPQESIRK
jgi:hypothetical protein